MWLRDDRAAVADGPAAVAFGGAPATAPARIGRRPERNRGGDWTQDLGGCVGLFIGLAISGFVVPAPRIS
jgi:hypothetical protein